MAYYISHDSFISNSTTGKIKRNLKYRTPIKCPIDDVKDVKQLLKHSEIMTHSPSKSLTFKSGVNKSASNLESSTAGVKSEAQREADMNTKADIEIESIENVTISLRNITEKCYIDFEESIEGRNIEEEGKDSNLSEGKSDYFLYVLFFAYRSPEKCLVAYRTM